MVLVTLPRVTVSRARNAVFGFRVGVDFGGHFGRVIVGFGYHYGVLVHTGGPVRVSQLFVGNLALAQVGVSLGAPHLTFPVGRRGPGATCRVVMRGRDVPGACPPRSADGRMHDHDP